MSKDQTFLKILEFVVLCGGVWVAYSALEIYKQQAESANEQAKIAVLNELDQTDQKLSQMQIDKGYIASAYSDVAASLSHKEAANLYLALAADCGNKGAPSCDSKEFRLHWETIPELDCVLWQGANFNTPTKQKMRDTYLHLELALYLVARAFERKDLIKDDEYEIWASYIRNTGHHPLMLTAIHHGYTRGYISEEFMVELRRLLGRSAGGSERASAMIDAVYKDFKNIKLGSSTGRVSCP